jgi:hypothetical protein
VTAVVAEDAQLIVVAVERLRLLVAQDQALGGLIVRAYSPGGRS